MPEEMKCGSELRMQSGEDGCVKKQQEGGWKWADPCRRRKSASIVL